MKISVFGLGYVGSVSAACLASIGHEVIGVDVNSTKVKMINAGQSPAIEKGRPSRQRGGQPSPPGRDQRSGGPARHRPLAGLRRHPQRAYGILDPRPLSACVRDRAGPARQNQLSHGHAAQHDAAGHTEGDIIPILEQASGCRAGQDFGVVFNPEFLREGTAVQDFRCPPFTVIGQHEPRGAETAARLYEGIEAPLLIVPVKVAEMVKYTNNAFHALKVAFANEIGNICKRQGIDSHQVMDIFCRDQSLNLSAYYLRPGFAFGGSCLPKDVRALLYSAHHLDLTCLCWRRFCPATSLQVRHGFELIRQTGCRRVGVLGFSFKAGTDDLRESPVVELIESLIGKGYQVSIYDQNVSLARLYAPTASISNGLFRTLPR